MAAPLPRAPAARGLSLRGGSRLTAADDSCAQDDKDRHPKVGEGVLLGANSTVLGNIKIAKGSMVAAGSLVLKPVRPYTMVAGNPAKEVGKIDMGGYKAPPAITMKQKVSGVGLSQPLETLCHPPLMVYGPCLSHGQTHERRNPLLHTERRRDVDWTSALRRFQYCNEHAA